MIDEKGELMSGMHHEEEGLPGFVYGLRENGPDRQNQATTLRNGGGSRCRGKCAFLSSEDPMADIIPYNEFNTTVTQKMETPVIYFYGNSGEKVQVEVGFPGWIISQWFPAASDFNLQEKEFKNGYMKWNVLLKDVNDKSSFPETKPTSIWNPARETAANTIQTNVKGTEEEKFIFYRGLGDFNVPLKLSLKNISAQDLQVTMTNTSEQSVPALFYLETDEETGVKRFLALTRLGAHETKVFRTSKAQTVKSASSVIQKALMAQGLFADEALSMLKTWDKSYFYTKGERLLYILPQAWTETILPMKLNPVPEKLVRVLIGRIELFSQNAQAVLTHELATNPESFKNDRLLEAKLNTLKK